MFDQAALRRNTVDVLPSKRLPQPLGLVLLNRHLIAGFPIPNFQELSLLGKSEGERRTAGK